MRRHSITVEAMQENVFGQKDIDEEWQSLGDKFEIEHEVTPNHRGRGQPQTLMGK